MILGGKLEYCHEFEEKLYNTRSFQIMKQMPIVYFHDVLALYYVVMIILQL
jgi:hypothetical protein